MRYRKKPVVIDAVLFTGKNVDEIIAFTGGLAEYPDDALVIKTLEGTMICEEGDYVIRGVKGEFYPCKPDIFKATYEQVD